MITFTILAGIVIVGTVAFFAVLWQALTGEEL